MNSRSDVTLDREQLSLIRDALTGGHTGDLSAEGQCKYMAALDIIDRILPPRTRGVSETRHDTLSPRGTHGGGNV